MIGITAREQRRQILLDHRFYGQWTLLERRAAVAGDAFIRGHANGNQIMTVGTGDEALDVFDDGWGHGNYSCAAVNSFTECNMLIIIL